MEFLELLLFLAAAIVLYFKPEKKALATSLAVIGCALLVVLEFYVNLWVVVPIGNY
ncbi:hypothetical protein [Campylobacter curvus]|uniref:hypothetical protein n=1 Tax=Campylobacter curvus TaxID=200 RepID=UPI00035E7235|nr:hypothetical protein [Campylobacter curvus]QKF60655.1 putative membrane protein [Campylobacter curvus]UEB48980.1 hypothetical protein LK426_04955 [Campylobacter curvus]